MKTSSDNRPGERSHGVVRGHIGALRSGSSGIDFTNADASEVTDITSVTLAGLVATASSDGAATLAAELGLADLTAMTPTQLVANTDNWAPVDATEATLTLALATIIRASTDASRNLTGIVAPDPATERLVIIANVGAFDLVLKHDVTSTAANRFYCPNDTDLTLQKDATAFLIYDTTSARWRAVGGGGALSVSEVDGSPVNATTTALVFPNDSVTFAGSVATIRQVPYGFIGAQIVEATAQSVADDTDAALTSNDAEVFDTDSFHDTSSNTSRMTIPAGLGGKYTVRGTASFAADADGYRGVFFKISGVATDKGHLRVPSAGSAVATLVSTSATLDLTAGQYVEMFVHHTAGAATNVTMMDFTVVKLGSGSIGSGIGASAFETTAQSITDDTDTALTANDADRFDTDSFHDTSSNTSRQTVPAGLAGKYLVRAQASFAADADGYRAAWFKVDGVTVEHTRIQVGSAGSAVATTLIATAVLDLAAAQYVETFVRHTAGAALNVTLQDFSIMRIDSGGTAAKGTAFPTGPATNDRFFRTDHGMEFYYNGTSWLCTCPHFASLAVADVLDGGTANLSKFAGLPANADHDCYLVKAWITAIVLTTNSGSHYWTFQFATKSSPNTNTNRGSSVNTSADAATTYVQKSITLGIDLASTELMLLCIATKTGTPGALYFFPTVEWRRVAT